MGVLVSGTRLHVRRAASMLLVLDVSSPRLDDKHQGYTDLLHPICDVRLSGPSGRPQWRRHHGSSWTDGSHSLV